MSLAGFLRLMRLWMSEDLCGFVGRDVCVCVCEGERENERECVCERVREVVR